MRLRIGLLAASAASLAMACALIVDLPSSVSVAAPDASVPEAAVSADTGPAPGCPTGAIKIKLFDASKSLSVADVALPIFLGSLDLLREINETGGVRGCRLDYDFKPVVFGDPASAVTAYEAFEAQPDWADVVALFGSGSADTIAVGPKAAAARKVMISVAYNGTLASPKPRSTQVAVPETSSAFVTQPFETTIDTPGYPFVFFNGTDYSTAIRIAMFYVSSISPGARVGFVHCEFNEFCVNPLAAGRTYAEQQGLLIGRSLLAELTDRSAEYGAKVTAFYVSEARYALANPTYVPVSWLWGGNLTSGSFFLAAALGRIAATTTAPDGVTSQEWTRARELADATRIIANVYGFDESLPDLCARLGVGASTCARIHGTMPLLAFGDPSTGASAMAPLVALHDKWRARDVNESYSDPSVFVDAGIPVPTTRSVRYVQGHMNVKLLALAIERAIDLGRPITGESLKEALESFRSEDTGGLTAPLTFGPEDHRPQSSLSIYQVEVLPDGGVDAGPLARLRNVSPNRRLTLQSQWLGW